MQRKIIHIDCDCYYAALEERDFAELRGKPVAVGGTGPRSVLATCNYIARQYGVRSAMPSSMALARCPGLIIRPARFEVYRSVSQQIRAILNQYTDKIEPLSLDEAYIDVSDSSWFSGSATLLAEHIRQQIYQQLGIRVSAGVAPNKYLAKIASDWNKPNGLFVVEPSSVPGFVMDLPVQRVSGIGQKFAEKLAAMGIKTCGDLQKWSLPRLVQLYGKSGVWLYQRARGIDERDVGRQGAAKSMTVEHTYETNLETLQQSEQEVQALYRKLSDRLSDKTTPPLKSILLKVRYADFKTQTIERNWALSIANFQRLLRVKAPQSEQSIRLLGLGVRFANETPASQLSLWPND